MLLDVRSFVIKNKTLNKEEFLAGKTILKSFPTKLGIDIYGVCNFRPACVYCSYDFDKFMEGKNTFTPFTAKTLEDYGKFFYAAESMSNCSIGEPLLSASFSEIIEKIDINGKYLEFSTNGLLLDSHKRKVLSGKNLTIYISLDAATAETFAKLRNNTFEKIIANIKNMILERKNNLPKIYLVFMPMKVNISELKDFIRLASDLGVDAVVLRPLNEIPFKFPLHSRGNHRFYYHRERFSFEELVDISKRAYEYAQQFKVPILNQLNFSQVLDKTLSAENILKDNHKKGLSSQSTLPLCEEPWTSLYILRKGLKPCSYGKAIGKSKDYRTLWNGKKIVDIRKHLVLGELSYYCKRNKSCPVVRKYFYDKDKKQAKKS